MKVCLRCRGAGVIETMEHTNFGTHHYNVICYSCFGSGTEICRTCHGTGTVSRELELSHSQGTMWTDHPCPDCS